MLQEELSKAREKVFNSRAFRYASLKSGLPKFSAHNP
jgi:hypothetical protein